jgi:microtubule-associated protein 1 light chain
MKNLPNDFIANNSLEKRKNQVTTIMSKYSNKIPVVVLFSKDINKNRTTSYIKYLFSDDLRSNYISMILRKNVILDPRKSIFLLSDTGSILPNNCEIGEFYHKYKNEDGYLYIQVHVENTFGSR